MYAQLCKFLVEKAPNFDPPESNACTFKRLLLKKCKDEFENRVQIAQEYEKSSATNELEEDSKYMAKRKMLGNIKFMGELGKLEIVHDTILHRCCEQLLVGRRKQPIPDQAEDLECLCHLMKTCGRILDTPVAKVRMDQYFDRLLKAANNENMPVRIRFMIQDVMDMRRNKWLARRIGKAPEGPRTIQQVREDAARDGCIYMPQDANPNPNTFSKNHMPIYNPLEGNFFDKGNSSGKNHGKGGRRNKHPMDDIFGVSGGYYLGTGPGTINSGPFEMDNNEYDGMNKKSPKDQGTDRNKPTDRNSDRNKSGGNDRNDNNQGNRHHRNQNSMNNMPLPDFGDRYSANRTKDRLRREQQKNQHGNHDRRSGEQKSNGKQGWNLPSDQPRSFNNHRDNQTRNNPEAMSNEVSSNLPPRFKKMNFGMTSTQNHRMNEVSENENKDLTLKPQTSSMIFKPKTPSLLPKSAKPNILDPEPNLLPSGPSLPPASGKIMQAPILIEKKPHKVHHSEKAKPKGPTREEVFNKVEALLEALIAKESTNEAVESWKEASIPGPMTQTAINHLYKVTLDKNLDLELVLSFVSQSVKDGQINNTNCNEAFIKVLNNAKDPDTNAALELSLSKIAAKAIVDDIMELKELFEIVRGSKHFRILFLSLFNLVQCWGQDKTLDAFEASNVKLLDSLPEDSKTESVLAQLMSEQKLSFLMPLLSLKKDMEAHVGNPTDLATWIGSSVDSKHHNSSDFILALFQVVFNYIVKQDGGPEVEKELLTKYKPVLKPFVAEKPKLQLAAVYALQMSCYASAFPKGLLLRSFVNFYEMDIVDEHAFLLWKEDVDESYPGKGKALFQVNSWLTWLEEAESEEEEESDGEE